MFHAFVMYVMGEPRDSYPTRLQIKEVAQRNGTGPPDQIQLIHGERYMKTLVTLHLLIPVWVGNGLLVFNL